MISYGTTESSWGVEMVSNPPCTKIQHNPGMFEHVWYLNKSILQVNVGNNDVLPKLLFTNMQNLVQYPERSGKIKIKVNKAM